MSQKQDTDRASSFIRIDDPDMPVYRVYPLWFFQEALRLKQLALVQPSSWPDPYEQLPWRCKIVQTKPEVRQAMLAPYLWPVYAQCWSATEESETLLRAYSRVVKHPHLSRNQFSGEEGVTVRSTPRKLLESLQTWAPLGHKDCCSVGRVEYFDDEGVRERIGSVLSQQLPDRRISVRQMAEFMLLKRSTFEHENEVRLIYVETREMSPPDRITCEIEPNEIFDAVKFDPRLASFEIREREESARKLGYDGEFVTSNLYTAAFMTIMID